MATLYAVYATGSEAFKVRKFSSKKAAQSTGNGFYLAASAEELAETAITNKQLLDVFNAKPGLEKPVGRFKDRITACQRVLEIWDDVPVEKGAASDASAGTAGNAKTAKAPKAAKAAKAAKADGDGDGDGAGAGGTRKSSNSGKTLNPAPKLKIDGEWTNPRREGSHGNRSMQIILDEPGISYEEFVAKGGRPVDLNWDIKHGNVVVS